MDEGNARRAVRCERGSVANLLCRLSLLRLVAEARHGSEVLCCLSLLRPGAEARHGSEVEAAEGTPRKGGDPCAATENPLASSRRGNQEGLNARSRCRHGAEGARTERGDPVLTCT